MSLDLFLHASEDQTRKIPKSEVDAAMVAIPGVSITGKREYRLAGEEYEIELEVETETAAGGDVKGVYVHVAAGAGRAAFERAKELALALVDGLELVIYDHQLGSYVSRADFAAMDVPDDGVMFRVAKDRDRKAEPAPAAAAASPPTPAPAAAASGGGGCAGVLLLAALPLVGIALHFLA